MKTLDLKPHRKQFSSANEVMRAAANPAMWAILEKLAKGDKRWKDIGEELKITPSALGMHMKRLVEMELVRSYKVPSTGTRVVMYALSPRVNKKFVDAVCVISRVK